MNSGEFFDANIVNHWEYCFKLMEVCGLTGTRTGTLASFAHWNFPSEAQWIKFEPILAGHMDTFNSWFKKSVVYGPSTLFGFFVLFSFSFFFDPRSRL